MPSDLEVVLEAIHTELNDATVNWGLYRTRLPVHEQLRRVVWIPTDFSNEPIKLTNPLIDENGLLVDMLCVDEITLEAHITGKDFADMCQIRVAILQAVRRVLGTDYELAGGEYRTQNEDVAGVMYAAAEKVVQRFRFCLNVAKAEPRTNVIVESIDQAVQLGDTTEGTFTLTEDIG